MAVSKDQKQLFNEKIRAYKACVDDLRKELSTVKAAAKKNPKLAGYFEFKQTALIIQMANTLVMMSRLSLRIQGLKNETYLNDARKELSGRLNDFLKATGDDLDGGLSENKERVLQFQEATPKEKLNLLISLRNCIEELKEVQGATSKWRWTYPDLHLKAVQLARNLFDFREYERSRDPNEAHFRDRIELLQFLIEELQIAAQEYRSKFELSTKDETDLIIVKRLLELMKKIYTLTGNRSELDKVKTQIDANNEKIEAIVAAKKDKKGKK